MLFRIKKINERITMIYGFKRKHDPKYVLTMTLIKEKNATHVHGLLSKVDLSAKDFLSLWKFMVTNLKTKYMIFEVIPQYAKVYKAFLPIEETYIAKTFNGFTSEILKVRLKNDGRSLFEGFTRRVRNNNVSLHNRKKLS